MRAIDAGIKLLQKGHLPYIPHLTHWVDKRAQELGINFTWEDYMNYDDKWLQLCDAILYLGSSTGADIELQRAKDLGLKIYYNIKDI